jgi:heme/copper-type cytochrome/quinol oxidase subunit 4
MKQLIYKYLGLMAVGVVAAQVALRTLNWLLMNNSIPEQELNVNSLIFSVVLLLPVYLLSKVKDSKSGTPDAK